MGEPAETEVLDPSSPAANSGPSESPQTAQDAADAGATAPDASTPSTPAAQERAPTLHFSFNNEPLRHNNLEYIDDETVILGFGNSVQFVNVVTGQLSWLIGTMDSIGAVAVHPSRQYFAVGEKGDNPNLYIYEWPSLKLFRKLQGGTERAYSAISFDRTGSKLASVGSDPDFMLTVWNWMEEKILLRSKAFGQEIYKVTFSQSNDSRLTTSGMGHIKFWTMAHTFTGLKLQGLIGKFGRIEISDIIGYVELPDGKVLSGSETGRLLMWEGNFIKCEIARSEELPCHDGAINIVLLEGNTVVTAGQDGFIRYWSHDELDAAEASDEHGLSLHSPIREIHVGDNVKITAMTKGSNPDHWVVYDANGALWRVDVADEGQRDGQEATEESETQSESHPSAVTSLTPNSFDRVAITAGSDGVVRIFDIVSLIDTGEEQQDPAIDSHRSQAHDADLRSVSTTFDNAFVLSVDNEGCFIVQRINTASNEVSAEEAELEEELRRKAEEDRLIAEAEERKRLVREELADIRRECATLLELNNSTNAQLEVEELLVDPSLKDLMEREKEARLQQARDELLWESTKKEIALNKLKAAFIDSLVVEHIVIKAFKTAQQVSSFRVPTISERLQSNIDAVHKLIEKEETNRRLAEKQQLEKAEASPSSAGSNGVTTSSATSGARRLGESAKASGSSQTAQDKAEARKIEREARMKELNELMARKPDDTYEDPMDVQAIIKAETNMGDYKLKTSEDYVVPDSLRVNAERKHRQMVLLEESIHTLKMDFNERLLALRDLKRRMVAEISKANERIREINEQLGLGVHGPKNLNDGVFEVSPLPCEFPENRNQIDRQTLIAYEQQKEQEARKRERQAQAAKAGGFGGFGTPDDDSADGRSGQRSARAPSRKSSARFGYRRESVINLQERQARMREEQQPVDPEAEALAMQQLVQEKERLIRKVEKTVDVFDKGLDQLRSERIKLEADLKHTDMRMLLLYWEYEMLKEFDKREALLLQRLEARQKEKAGVYTKILACQNKLYEKRGEIEQLLAREKQIMAEFKNLAGAEEDDDPVVQQKLEELRERKAEQEQILDNFQRSIEAIRTENEELMSEEKAIDAALKEVENEIDAFQREKQARMNDLDVVVVLKMNQIQCLLQNKLPEDQSELVLFTTKGEKQLRRRIQEIAQEKVALQRQKRELKRQHVSILKRHKEKQEFLESLKAKVEEVQLLKFGRNVDLESLENASVDLVAEELKDQIRKEEDLVERQLKQWDKRIEEHKEKLTEVTRQNTAALERIAQLQAEQLKLEQDLNLAQTTLIARIQNKKKIGQ